MAANKVYNSGAENTLRGRSPIIWADYGWEMMNERSDLGGSLCEDFKQWAGPVGGSIVKLTAVLSPALIAQQTTAQQTIAFAGVLATDIPIAISKPTNQAGLAISQSVLVPSAGNIQINFINVPAGGNITPTATETYTLYVWRPQGFYTGDTGGWRTQEGGATLGSVVALSSDYPTNMSSNTTSLGTIRLSSGALAHNSVCLEGLGAQYGLSSTLGNFPKLFFECRVRFNQATAQDFFCGLAVPGETSGMNTVFNTSDAFQVINQIGFNVLTGTPTVIQAGYGKSGQTNVTVGNAGAVPTTLTNWTKLGFVFDPTNAAQPLKFYQDGVLLGSQTISGITAASFPTAVALVPCVYGQIGGSGATQVTFDLDWICVGQVMGQE